NHPSGAGSDANAAGQNRGELPGEDEPQGKSDVWDRAQYPAVGSERRSSGCDARSSSIFRCHRVRQRHPEQCDADCQLSNGGGCSEERAKARHLLACCSEASFSRREDNRIRRSRFRKRGPGSQRSDHETRHHRPDRDQDQSAQWRRPVQRGLASGQLDIGMLYLSDMLPNKDITIVGVLPKEISTPTAIVGFISTKASDPPGAKALLEYLASPEAQAIFKEAGFQPHS